jgi:hypothetical protein
VHRREREVGQDQAHDHLGRRPRVDAPELPRGDPLLDQGGEALEAARHQRSAVRGDPRQQQRRLLVPAAGEHRMLHEEGDADEEGALESRRGRAPTLDGGVDAALEAVGLALEQRIDHGVLVREVPVQGRLARPASRAMSSIVVRRMPDSTNRRAAAASSSSRRSRRGRAAVCCSSTSGPGGR